MKYEEVYQGIDLIVYGNQRQLEYDFTVNPGADPKAIELRFEGPEMLSINAQGDLILHTSEGEIRQHKPQLYQEAGGVKQNVAGRYVLKSEYEIGFDIGHYDSRKPLVIDPVIGNFSTYLGGTQGDVGVGIAVDSLGRACVRGTVTSPDFPSTSGSRHDVYYEDVFITKLSADGSSLIYSTILGGIYGDDGYAITVDREGNAYVTGPTGFPGYPTMNAYQSSGGSSDGSFDDAFVTKLDLNGNIVYSTYLGGSSADDGASSIAVDKSGNAYVSGYAKSNNVPTVNSFQNNLSTTLSK